MVAEHALNPNFDAWICILKCTCTHICLANAMWDDVVMQAHSSYGGGKAPANFKFLRLKYKYICICKCIWMLGIVGWCKMKWCGNASSFLPRWPASCGILISQQNLPRLMLDDGHICKMIEQLNAPLSKGHTLFAGGVISFVEICAENDWISSCVQSPLIFLWLLWIQETHWKCVHAEM